jgi:hypothetical protein
LAFFQDPRPHLEYLSNFAPQTRQAPVAPGSSGRSKDGPAPHGLYRVCSRGPSRPWVKPLIFRSCNLLLLKKKYRKAGKPACPTPPLRCVQVTNTRPRDPEQALHGRAHDAAGRNRRSQRMPLKTFSAFPRNVPNCSMISLFCTKFAVESAEGRKPSLAAAMITSISCATSNAGSSGRIERA